MKRIKGNIAIVIIATLFALAVVSSCESIIHDTSEAQERGTKAADAVIAIDTVAHPDTLQLQRALLEANSILSEYELAGEDYNKKAFNRAFKSRLLEADSMLAITIFPEILYE